MSLSISACYHATGAVGHIAVLCVLDSGFESALVLLFSCFFWHFIYVTHFTQFLTSDSTVCFVFLPNTPACYCTCSSPLSLPQPPSLDSTFNSPHSFVHLLFQFIMWIRIIPTAIKSPKVTTFVTARPRAVAASVAVAVAVSVMPNH